MPPIVCICIENEWKFVQVHIILEAVLGDTLSNDVICGRVVQNCMDIAVFICVVVHVTSLKNQQMN
jgi:hypothetical protein